MSIYETDMRGYIINDFSQAEAWKHTFVDMDAALEPLELQEHGNISQVPESFSVSINS